MKFASKTLSTLIAPLALLIAPAMVRAQAYTPVAVISLPSYEKLLADVDFFGKLGGQPGLSQQMDGMIRVFTQGQGLKGLDKTKPWGVALTLDNSEPVPVAFLPVSSAKDLLDVLAGVIGPAEDEGGALKINPPNCPPLYVREKDGWAFISQSKDSPLPDDPMKLLGGLNSQYDIAARAYLQNIPAETKKSWLDTLQGFSQMAAAMQQGKLPPEVAELNRQVTEYQMKGTEQLLNEGDQITLGWKLDTQAKNTDLDLSITAKPGTPLDTEMQQLADTHSDFAGFYLPDVGVAFNGSFKIPAPAIELLTKVLDQRQQKAEESVSNDSDLSEDARAQVKTVLQQLFDLAKQTVKNGKLDHASAISFASGKLQFISGTCVADGPALETALKNLLNLVKGEPNFDQNATVKLDLETYKEIHFHEITFKLPEQADEDARKVLGDSLDLYFGVGPQSAYFSVGPGSLDLMKQAIDKSEPNKAVLPMQFAVAMGPLANFVTSIKGDDPDSSKMKAFAKELDKVKGKDHLLVTVKSISNGELIRFHVEEGVLEASGNMSKMRMKAGRPGGQGAMPGGPGG